MVTMSSVGQVNSGKAGCWSNRTPGRCGAAQAIVRGANNVGALDVRCSRLATLMKCADLGDQP